MEMEKIQTIKRQKLNCKKLKSLFHLQELI